MGLLPGPLLVPLQKSHTVYRGRCHQGTTGPSSPCGNIFPAQAHTSMNATKKKKERRKKKLQINYTDPSK